MHQAVDLQSQTLVVVHDACYGHRFSRPRTSRAGLDSIVERPERIRAGVLGVSAAYVRLGRRHSGERFAPHPDLDVHLLPAPPFQIRKTARSMAISSPAVTNVHGTKWMADLQNMCDAAESRLALNGKELVRPQSAGKDESTTNAAPLHEGDLYLCSESLNAFEGALGGVCEGVDAVFGTNSAKRAFVCIRPPGHHCSAGHPSGFCWINNVHVGISYAAMTHGLTHAAILDFDLHHGDGSQEIAWDQNRKATNAPKNAANHKKTMIGYFSLHDINSYPCEMGDPEKVRNASLCIDKAHGQSIWNVHLEPWKTTSEFWDLYATRYALLIEKARAFLRHHTERLANSPNGPPPKAAVFISAGFDASEWEGSGMQRHKVNVPTDFYAKFTADVVQMANEEGLGAQGRVISVLEGGYSDRALTSGILSHLSGLGDATPSAEDANGQSSRLKSEMTDRLGLSTPPPVACEPTVGADFNTDWWSSNFLEELEALVYPLPAPAKPREKTGPTYSAPTQSFAAKVVATTRDRKSIGSQADSDTPPPLPEVGWATAVHELSKVIIPNDRQTMSCRPEELKADIPRARRERQTALEDGGTGAGLADSRMRLRARRPKASVPNTPNQQTIKGSRRSTIDPASDLQKSLALRDSRKIATPPASDMGDFDGAGDQKTPPRASVGKSGQTSRPGTSSSQSSTADTRVRTTRSGTPKRTASPKKAPPVPKVPSTFLTPGNEDGKPQYDIDSMLAEMKSRRPEMERLNIEVRKIWQKPKVPSLEEYDPREEEAVEQRQSPTMTSGSLDGKPQYDIDSMLAEMNSRRPEMERLNTEIMKISRKSKVPLLVEYAAREEEASEKRQSPTMTSGSPKKGADGRPQYDFDSMVAEMNSLIPEMERLNIEVRKIWQKPNVPSQEKYTATEEDAAEKRQPPTMTSGSSKKGGLTPCAGSADGKQQDDFDSMLAEINTLITEMERVNTEAKKFSRKPKVPSLEEYAACEEEAAKQRQSHTMISGSPNEVDSLNSDVGKLRIKLKVPSPEEHAAREEKAAKQRQPPTTTSKSPKKGGLTPRTGNADGEPQDEMDSLTAEMDSLNAEARKLRIKLKMPSPEEHAAQEKKAAKQRQSPATTSKSPKKGALTPRAKRPVMARRARSSPTKSQASSVPTTPVETVAGLKHENPTESASGPLTPPLPEKEASSITTTAAEPELGGRTAESLTTLTPETGAQGTVHTPSKFAVPDKHSLPIFTSKSTIPFAPVGVANPSKGQAQSENRPSTTEHITSEKDDG